MQTWFDDNWDISSLAREVDQLQLLDEGPSGYRLRRIILANYWLYETQVFEIPHGRVFLAGANASGKSTVLTAALPLLLEGTLRSDRFDTFGKQSRHIEYYILGNETSATSFTIAEDKRTAYLALEFEWCDPHRPPIAPTLHSLWEKGVNSFLTVGMSITGNKKATAGRINAYHFLITDGSRLLYDIPFPGTKLTANQFREALKEHGVLCSTQQEYREYIARYLFGMRDMGVFHKLIGLLLALRQPNLSSQLTLNDVHEHLTNSLPTIPGEVTRQAVETVNAMEELAVYIERLECEQQNVHNVEDAQQALILAEARLAFDTYKLHLYAHHMLEEHLQTTQTRLQQETGQLAETRQKFQDMEQEKKQAIGSIQALEQNEGIQLANQIAQVEQRVKALREQVTQQQQSVVSTQRTISLHVQQHSQQSAIFQQDVQDTQGQLHDLWDMAERQAHWQEAASRLSLSLKQVERLPFQNLETQQVIKQIEQKLHLDATEHLRWLHELTALHLQKNELTREIEAAATLEKEKQSDVDNLWKHFKGTKRRFELAFEQVNKILEQIITDSSELASSQVWSVEEFTQPVSDVDPEEHNDSLKESSSYMEVMSKCLETSKRDLEVTLGILTRINAQTQKSMNELQTEIFEKSIRYQDLQQVYEAKQIEQENLPEHSQRRTTARKRLSAHGIRAFPLYLLIDFVPDLASEEAGRIEYMLEDAGVLDALVVLEQDCLRADTLLLTDNISDYRIDTVNLPEVLPGTSLVLQKLRFDSAARSLVSEIPAVWEAFVTRILLVLEQTLLAEDTRVGCWKHGLLVGQCGSGSAQFIGRSTRLQVRQQELEALKLRLTALAQDLDTLTQNQNQLKKRHEHLQDSLLRLQTVRTTSNLDATYSEAQACAYSLEQARSHLRAARQNIYQKRQQRTQLLTTLEKTCQPYPFFAQQSDLVSQALQSTTRLVDTLPFVSRNLQKIASLDQEILGAANLLEQARAEETYNAALLLQLQNQLIQEESTYSELQNMGKREGVDNLSQRLWQLRQRVVSLDGQLSTLAMRLAVLEDHVQTQPDELAKLTEQCRNSQLDLQKKQEYCLELLSTLSIHAPKGVFLHLEKDSEALVNQLLQMPEQDEDTQANSLKLETDLQHAWIVLQEAFLSCVNLLHAYEPELDHQARRVTFHRENDATPAQLLGIIDKNLGLQKDLLQQEEKQLFEQFLLEDMADLLHTHISQALDWIREINASLATMPFIGDKYELEWQAKTSFEELPFGRFLAQHLPLLSKKVHDLSDGQRLKLRDAFLQEIRTIREMPQGESNLNIEQRLQAVFDYRRWFRFKIYTISQTDQRQQLTHKLLASRSGAEQLFALYVPLLAALTAIYNSAAPGAPRLLGLDEAFDKASLDNVQQMIGFLAKQGFQWIMTGPQLHVSGADVPVIIRYLMLREQKVATAIPQIWQGRRWADSENIHS